TFAPASGSLAIVTNPRGADVSVNGEPLADVTPVRIDRIATGSYEVAVSLHGRQAKSATVEVFPDTETERSFELERVAMGTLSVQTVPGNATVTLDAVADYRPGVELPVGDYRIRVAAPGYGTAERTVGVRQGRNVVDITLARVFGALRISIRPANARVRVTYPDVDGSRDVAFQDGMELPAGPFAVRATAMGYRNLVRNLAMDGDGVTLRLAMQRFEVTPGQRFRDRLQSGGEGPQLVVVAAGAFRMGRADGALNERPTREVRVTQPFAIGVYETTVADFEHHDPWPGEPGMPVRNITLRDVGAYLAFLSRETGYRYRLPTEAEWEYAARAGGTGDFYFGNDLAAICAHGNVGDLAMQERFRQYDAVACNDGFVRVAPVGRFAPNAFGLHDVFGNVEEWVADCWHPSYEGAPGDARQWTEGCYSSRVVRGGAFDTPPGDLRVSARNMGSSPTDSRGFRVVREL
ncbi:MAG: SUMF1/EgtB/PvdO family nonheme iron enzyme, partial [Gammaproteobacteria bacterium]|nr:SUMF1/EgtB/PvdO family nonheme iron enzyme [Gammaproteobacteria bacterium]